MNSPEQVSPSPEPESFPCPGCGKPVVSAKQVVTGRQLTYQKDRRGGMADKTLELNEDGCWVERHVFIGGSHVLHHCPSPPDTSWFIFGDVEDIPDWEEAGYNTKRPRGRRE